MPAWHWRRDTTRLRQGDCNRENSCREQEWHCVDVWVLAAAISGAHYPTTTSLYYLEPIRVHRRQLHRLQFSKGGIRKRYGDTMSLGLKRGSLVHHSTYGTCYIGDYTTTTASNRCVGLHSVETGKRLTQNGKREDLKVITRVSFRTQFLFPVNRGFSLR